MTLFRYRQDSEDPAWTTTWLEDDGTPVDLSAATITLKLVNVRTRKVALTKTSGITGTDDTTRNLTVVWDTDELDLPVGRYHPHVNAVIGGRDRPMPRPEADVIEIYAAPT